MLLTVKLLMETEKMRNKLSILILSVFLLNSQTAFSIQSSCDNIHLESKGQNSPNIYAPYGIVIYKTIYKISQERKITLSKKEINNLVKILTKVVNKKIINNEYKLNYIVDKALKEENNKINDLESKLDEAIAKINDLSDRIDGIKYNEKLYKQAKNYFNKGQFGEADKLFENVTNDFDKIEAKRIKENKEYANLFYIQGDLKYLKELKYQDAYTSYIKAAQLDPNNNVYLYNAGRICYELGKYDEALTWYNKAREIDEKVFGFQHPTTAETYNDIGIVYTKQGKYDEAMAWYNKARDIDEKVFGFQHPTTVGIYIGIGNIYFMQGKYDEALTWLNKAREIFEKVADFKCGIGISMHQTQDVYKKSRLIIANVSNGSPAQKAGIKRGDEIFQIDDKSTQDMSSQGAEYLIRGNKGAEVKLLINRDNKEHLYTVIRDYIKISSPVKIHRKIATVYNNIGLIYQSQGKYDEALTWLNKAREIREKVFGFQHPSTAGTYNNIGLIYKSQGKFDEALTWFNKARDIDEKVVGFQHPTTATIYNNIGSIYKSQGKFDEALTWFNKARDIDEKVVGFVG